MKQILIIGLKSLVVIIALVLGILGANQAGWSGAELVVNAQSMRLIEGGLTGLLAFAGAAIAIGTIVLVQRMAKPVLWFMIPVLLYFALIPGAWNGIGGDFDYTRVEAIKHQSANAYALEHMSLRARILSCKDRRIELTDDARAVCALALNADSSKHNIGNEQVK